MADRIPEARRIHGAYFTTREGSLTKRKFDFSASSSIRTSHFLLQLQLSLIHYNPGSDRAMLPTQANEAKPTTPPQSAGERGSGLYQCIIDYGREPYLVT
jgi:hypothetical protein